jgi:hypothetical protein
MTRMVSLLLSLVSVVVAVVTTSKEIKEPRIVGGSNANRASFPAMVLLGDRYEDLVCGATLISPTLVLTAAHCQEGVLTFALIGEYDTRDLEAYQLIPILQELPHPQYVQATSEFDMMLLRLEYPVKGLVQFQRLNSDPNIPVAAAGGGNPLAVTAVGWGYTRNGGTPSVILQQVTLDYVPNDECDAKENKGMSYQGEISDDMLCTFAVGKDTCYGDSGGPILLDDVSISIGVQGVQVGIVSWGSDQCADDVFPGVSMRVSSGYDWIRQWVCAIDGGINNAGGISANAPDEYQCDGDETYSPRPTPAPAVPTVSPAPTSYMIRLWIEIYLDESAFEVSWTLKDLTTNQEIVAESPSYEFEDEVVHVVDVWPSRNYQFTIQDTRGNGITDQGYYKISMGNVGDDLETAKRLLFDVGRFGYERSYTIEIPDRVVPSRATNPVVEPPPAPSTTITTTTPPPTPSCRNFGSLCVEASDCCTNKCRLGSCQKALPAAKMALSGSRGGGGGANGGTRKLVRGRG